MLIEKYFDAPGATLDRVMGTRHTSIGPSRMPRMLVGLVFVGLISCSPLSNPVAPQPALREAGDGFLTIQTEKAVYGSSEQLVRATLVNGSDRQFHAFLGDAMIDAQEQFSLMATAGSDGFLEEWVPPFEWRSMARPLMFEGGRSIVLQPHGSYTLFGYPKRDRTPLQIGPKGSTIRFRVQYFDGPPDQPGQTAHQDFSNHFILK